MGFLTFVKQLLKSESGQIDFQSVLERLAGPESFQRFQNLFKTGLGQIGSSVLGNLSTGGSALSARGLSPTGGARNIVGRDIARLGQSQLTGLTARLKQLESQDLLGILGLLNQREIADKQALMQALGQLFGTGGAFLTKKFG